MKLKQSLQTKIIQSNMSACQTFLRESEEFARENHI